MNFSSLSIKKQDNLLFLYFLNKVITFVLHIGIKRLYEYIKRNILINFSTFFIKTQDN